MKKTIVMKTKKELTQTEKLAKIEELMQEIEKTIPDKSHELNIHDINIGELDESWEINSAYNREYKKAFVWAKKGTITLYE